jgi:hypothetical protein
MKRIGATLLFYAVLSLSPLLLLLLLRMMLF